MHRLFALVLLTLLPQTAWASGVRMAVLEFAAAPGTSADWTPLGKGFQEMILVDLSKAGSIEVVERRAVREQRLALGVELPGSAATLADVGKRSGATHVLAGGFSVSGSAITLTSELVSVEDGSVVLSREVQGEAEAFFELEKEIVQASIQALDISLSARERAETGRLHTADFLAFQDFSRGLDEFDAERYEASLKSLRSAAERDQQFSLAAITLEQYGELVKRIRDKADAVHIVRAEQERLEKLSAAGDEVEVVRRLLAIARKEGQAAQRERLAALHTLAIAYGNHGTAKNKLSNMRRMEDRFAMQRASDELWKQYHREALPLWPRIPPQVDDTFYCGVPELDSFDKDFARCVDILWEKGADYPDNRRKYLQDSLRYPYNTGKRIHLSLADEVELHHRFFTELAPALPAPDWFYKHERDELLKAYRSVLRFDDATRLLERQAEVTENQYALRGIADKIEDHKEWVTVLRAAKDRVRMEEWMLLAGDSWSQGPVLTQGREHFSAKGPLDAEGAKLITRMRKWPSGDRGWIRLGEVPAWCHQHCYGVWSGPRVDLRVAESVRFYDKDPSEDGQALLFLDSAPRSGIDAGFTVRWEVADDFAPHGLEKVGNTPDAALLFGLVDLDVAKFKDPVSGEYSVPRPMHGYQLRVSPDAVAIERVTEAERATYDRKRLTEEELARKKVRVPEGARIGLSVRGRQVQVVVEGKTVLKTTLKEAPSGFAGLRALGAGYLEVADVRLSDSEG